MIIFMVPSTSCLFSPLVWSNNSWFGVGGKNEGRAGPCRLLYRKALPQRRTRRAPPMFGSRCGCAFVQLTLVFGALSGDLTGVVFVSWILLAVLRLASCQNDRQNGFRGFPSKPQRVLQDYRIILLAEPQWIPLASFTAIALFKQLS